MQTQASKIILIEAHPILYSVGGDSVIVNRDLGTKDLPPFLQIKKETRRIRIRVGCNFQLDSIPPTLGKSLAVSTYTGSTVFCLVFYSFPHLLTSPPHLPKGQ